MSTPLSQAMTETLPPRRHLRRTPAPGWRWLWQQPETAGPPPVAERAPSPSLSRPRRMRRTGRAVLVWSLGWFVVAQLAFLLIAEHLRPALIANELTKWPRLRQLVADHPERPLVLMFGSSRTAWALRAADLDGMAGPDGRPLLVYNFGMPTAGPIHQRMYLRDLLAEGIRPRLLLVEFTLPLLSRAHRGCYTEESMTKGAWTSLRQQRELRPYFAHPGRMLRAWIEARTVPWYAFRADLHEDLRFAYEGQKREFFCPPDEYGWRPLPRQAPSAEERASTWWLAVSMYGPGLSDFRLGTGPLRALREILGICRRERIPVALVVMPEGSPFRGLYSARATTAMHDILKELRDRYQVPVINARRWIADEDFEDTHHVLLRGADLFTSRLRGEIRRLLAQRPCDSNRGIGE